MTQLGYFTKVPKNSRAKIKLLELPDHSLVMDISTRWNSVYDMVEHLLEQQPPRDDEREKDQHLDWAPHILWGGVHPGHGASQGGYMCYTFQQIYTCVMFYESNLTLSAIAQLHAQLLQASGILSSVCQWPERNHSPRRMKTVYVWAGDDHT